ncbi:chalcone isomerase family protein [Enterovibrio coralii]|uniref:chalcone isomerase family protein n=1 Tax=Enterovibrio coralii TaxID=294935 RepID=UPI000AB41B01|nr:chalcone isomerase family protein [Enterovibrio coralii]
MDDIPVALVITYSRNIESADLLDATVEQWEHLGISSADIASWVPEMDGKWPDVNKGDRLIYVFNGEQGTFYYQPKNGDVSLSGHLNDSALAKAFSDIWLSPNTSYPSVRLALIGSKSQ